MRQIKRALFFFLALLLIAGIWKWETLKRLHATLTLFDPQVIVHNFSHMRAIYPTVEIPGSVAPSGFEQAPHPLPDTFHYKGVVQSVPDYLERTQTTALLVLKENTITHERYYLGTQPEDYRISWSVAKSFLSALFGIAVHEGYIKSLEQAVTDYVPELKGSGYDGVRIKDVLQMSSGVRFNEDYMDFNSDINRFGRTMALSGSFDAFAQSLVKERQAGTFMHYVSLDTHVAGMVLRAATGQRIVDYMQAKLWSKLHPEASVYYIVDGAQEPMVLGGMNLRTRDFARFGLLFLNKGFWQGEQVIPAAWVEASMTPDAAHLMPGERNSSEIALGYGYQWWIPVNADQEMLAWGIYGQYIYINQKARVVVVKNSANLRFADNNYESVFEDIEFFRAVAASLSETEVTMRSATATLAHFAQEHPKSIAP